jgi:GTP-binding protein LepA
VDAQQGVQAQTVANFLLSFEANLSIIPIINKIDLPLADAERVMEQLHNVFGFNPEEAIQISAKIGTRVDQIFPSIIDRIPCPSGSRDSPLRMLLFDSWYDHYRGVVCVVAIKDGSVGSGDAVSSSHTGLSYEVAEVGLLQIKRVPTDRLYSGQVGYVLLGMRNSGDAHVGDTFHHTGSKVTPLPGFRPAKAMVFAGFYPMDQSEYPFLRTALEKLILNDSSVSVFHDSSVALGQGFRLGFLGLLHMDVFRQRLEEEFDASIVVTTPSVPYKVVLKDGSEQTLLNPAQVTNPALNKRAYVTLSAVGVSDL